VSEMGASYEWQEDQRQRSARMGAHPIRVDPRRDDASSTWSRDQLARMDSDFCTRVRIAFQAGGESMSAPAATYYLPARRRAT